MPKRIYSDEQKDFIKSLAGRFTNSEIIELYADKFGVMLANKQLNSFRQKYKAYLDKDIASSISRRNAEKATNARKIYNEGDISKQGGKKYQTYFIKRNGKHVSLYKDMYESTYGEVPRGYRVISLVRDSTNLEDLVMVSFGVSIVFHTQYQHITDPELKRAMLLALTLEYEAKKRCSK
jgi:hypothetical protein